MKSLKKNQSEAEKAAWLAFKSVCTHFLGNRKAENYEDLVGDMVKCSRVIGCNLSLKLHVSDSHLNFFPQNLGAISEEHGERFHQDISMFEKLFSGRWNRISYPKEMVVYVWDQDGPPPVNPEMRMLRHRVAISKGKSEIHMLNTGPIQGGVLVGFEPGALRPHSRYLTTRPPWTPILAIASFMASANHSPRLSASGFFLNFGIFS
ncbi:hypothetical protein AVEN_102926-1 [Araneus ventricosus]|uniref:Uncharacterized protein n=1 Tax=Araneus ventricosus TaxID=182803 RepID=A0A4Y2MLC0_ARAVE|nr:hypothetical protein AVEN_102926-1 [Araneus ventricosus]